MSHPRNEFTRTECACNKCQAGCKAMPGSLAPGDAEAIADYLNVPDGEQEDFIVEHFCASEGSSVEIKGERFTIPTIVPRQKDNGECVFFKDGKCLVHPVKPFGCSHFDQHMKDEDADARSKAQLISCLIDDWYRTMWTFLKAAKCIASPIMERKIAMFQLLKKENEDGIRR